MNREVNIDSILALDAEISRLKRTRNSLLNIARIPPEILGSIFRFNITAESSDPSFAGIQKGSYNFLFVCYHWYEVARSTPELWVSWGNNLEDWKRLHLRSGTFALDLVLDGFCRPDEPFDSALQDALRGRATRDVVRKVHLRSQDRRLLASVLSSLNPQDEGVRDSNIESIILGDVDPSNFFARHRFPKLRRLILSGCPDIAFLPLKSHTTTLVHLSLRSDITSPIFTLTISHLLSFLASNPNLRSLELRLQVFSDSSGRDSGERVPLCHLESFYLKAKIHHIFLILDRLALPNSIDRSRLVFCDCTVEEATRAVGPYIRDYVRRDARFGARLGAFVLSAPKRISLGINATGDGYDGPEQKPREDLPYSWFTISLSQDTPSDAGGKLCIDTLALFPGERIVYLQTDFLEIEKMAPMMPNLEFLHLYNVDLSDGFLLRNADEPDTQRNFLPSLRRLYLESVVAENGDWSPLAHYLIYQNSANQSISLSVFGYKSHICSGWVTQIKPLVKDLVYLPSPAYSCLISGCWDQGT